MKKEININSKTFLSDGKSFEPKMLTLSSTTDEKFKKEIAMHIWAKIFEKLGIEYLHNPSVCLPNERKGIPEVDFYLIKAKTFVLVKGYSFEDYVDNYEKACEIAKETQCNVIVAYPDGRFRLADFYDHKERAEREENIVDDVPLSSEAMLCQCRKCNTFFATTNYGWWGCRNCGFYDGDNTAAIRYFGDEGILND